MNAQTKPKPTASETNGGDSHLKKFAAELGAPWLDPIPPAQYLQFATDPDCEPWLRVWATILARTIAIGYRSPFAIDRTTKKPLTIEDIAKGLKMDEGNARRALRRLLVQNRVRRDEEGRLWLAGVFELPRGPQPLNPDDDPAAILERSVTDLFKPYYARQIMRLKPHIIKELVSEREARGERSRFRLADVVAAGRLMDDRDDNVTMARYGINLIRETHDLPADKRAEIDARRLRAEDLIPVLEKHVQAFYKPVSKRSVTKGKSALLQTFEKAHAHAATTGEHKSFATAPRVLSEQQNKRGAAFVGNSNNKGESSSVSLPEDGQTTTLPFNDRIEELRGFLISKLGSTLLGKAPGLKCLQETLRNLNGASFADLGEVLDARDWQPSDSYGLVPHLAQDAVNLAQTPKLERKPQIPNLSKSERHEELRSNYFDQRMRQELEKAGKL